MKLFTLTVLLSGLFGSCAPETTARLPNPAPEQNDEMKGELSWNALGIPAGHMPPPGSCRIWYPNREPGQQPPPFKCGSSGVNVPLGALLVQRLDTNVVQVDEYDSKRPNYILRTGKFQLMD